MSAPHHRNRPSIQLVRRCLQIASLVAPNEGTEALATTTISLMAKRCSIRLGPQGWPKRGGDGSQAADVYVRGYAERTSDIDKQVDDPFYGFNDGSTHVRVDSEGEPL